MKKLAFLLLFWPSLVLADNVGVQYVGHVWYFSYAVPSGHPGVVIPIKIAIYECGNKNDELPKNFECRSNVNDARILANQKVAALTQKLAANPLPINQGLWYTIKQKLGISK